MFAISLPSQFAIISSSIASIALLSMAQQQPSFRPFLGAPNSPQPSGSRLSASQFPGTPTFRGQMPGGGTSIPRGPTVGGNPMLPTGRPQAGPQPNFPMGGKPMQPMGGPQPSLPASPMSTTSVPIIPVTPVTFTRPSLPIIPASPSLPIAPPPPPPAGPFSALATTSTTPATTLSTLSATPSAMPTTATYDQTPYKKKHHNGKDKAVSGEGNSDFEGDYGSEEDEIGVIEKTSNLTSGEDNRDVDSLMLDISSSALEDSNDIDESGAKASGNDSDWSKKNENSYGGKEKKRQSLENTSSRSNVSNDSIWADASYWDDSSTDRSGSTGNTSTAATVVAGNDTKETPSAEAPNSEDADWKAKRGLSSDASLLAGLSKSLLRSVLNDASDEEDESQDDGGVIKPLTVPAASIGGHAPTEDDIFESSGDIEAPYNRPRPRVLPWPGGAGTVSTEEKDESGEVGTGYTPPSRPTFPRPPQPIRIMPPLNTIGVGGRHDGLDEAIYGPMLPPNVLPPIHRGASLEEEGRWVQRQGQRSPPFTQAVQLTPTLTKFTNRKAGGGVNYRVKPGDFVG